MPDLDTMFGFDDEEDLTETPDIPDLDTMFGFDDDAYEDDDVEVQPVADGNSTDWMSQYEDDEEFGERPTDPIEEDVVEEPAKVDTGWLDYDADDSDVEDEYDPYAQYETGDNVEDDDEYEDIFAPGTPIDTDMLTTESNLFDAEQPVSDPIDHDETPDWLSGFDDDEFGESDEPTPAQTAPSSDTDSWLEQFGDETFDDAGMGEPALDPLDEVPDWLSGADEPASTDDSVQFDILSDDSADETISRVPTGLTGELDFVDDDLDFGSLDDVDDDISRSSTGLTGELAELGDDFDLELLDHVGAQDSVQDQFSRGNTG